MKFNGGKTPKGKSKIKKNAISKKGKKGRKKRCTWINCWAGVGLESDKPRDIDRQREKGREGRERERERETVSKGWGKKNEK